MTVELAMVWRQLGEVYEALRTALAEIPDERLHWQPSPDCMAPSALGQHVGRANVTYSQMMEFGERRPQPPYVEEAPRDVILSRLDASLEQVGQVFERMTPERLAEPVADDWGPIGAEVEGPLTALWFAHTMLIHSAYHVGQLVTLSLLLAGEAGRDIRPA